MSKVELKRESEKRLRSRVAHKLKRDEKLLELEEQLQFAESRCGTLKQQLDYIKMLYGNGKISNLEMELQPSFKEAHGGGDNLNYYNFEGPSIRKNSIVAVAVGNKENGDGPELINKLCSHSNSSYSVLSNKKISKQEEGNKAKSRVKQKGVLKFQKVKKKNTKRVKRRRKPEEVFSSKFSNVSSQTQSQICYDPVVEIYKNSSLNAESESGLDVGFNKKRMKTSEVLLEYKKMGIYKDSDDSKEKIALESKRKRSNSLNSRKPIILKEEGVQTEIPPEVLHQMQLLQKENEIKDVLNRENLLVFEPVKSYYQPTISSKKKQVDRDVYSGFNVNVRNIPFIAAKSTTPSHNIGVNIQQVLSIMKKKQLTNENSAHLSDTGNNENRLLAFLGSKKGGSESEPVQSVAVDGTTTSDSKKRNEAIKSNLSHWKSNSDFNREKPVYLHENISNEKPNQDWCLKVNKLKRVLVFLHEDFTSLSQKYKRLQKKLTKRNISKTDAKGELSEIEKDLEKKEDEITVIIGLYREVLNLKEDVKKLQEKCNMLTCGKTVMLDGLKQSNSTHTQMTTLLRKIQNFQGRLKG